VCELSKNLVAHTRQIRVADAMIAVIIDRWRSIARVRRRDDHACQP